MPAHRLRLQLNALALLPLFVLPALAGCGGGGAPEEERDAGPTASASASGSAGESAVDPGTPSDATASGVPAGTSLTAEGTSLRLGTPATLAYEPQPGEVGVLDLRVRRLSSTTWEESFAGWKIRKRLRSAQPYFVEGTVTNSGETDLGGRPLPLLAVGPGGVLVEATSFVTPFEPCRPRLLRPTFAPGDTMRFCLVYFVPDRGELEGVAFKPTDDVDAITWSGRVRPVRSGEDDDDDTEGPDDGG